MDTDRIDETILAVAYVDGKIDHWWWGKSSGDLRNQVSNYYAGAPHELRLEFIPLSEQAPRMKLLKHVQERTINMERYIEKGKLFDKLGL